MGGGLFKVAVVIAIGVAGEVEEASNLTLKKRVCVEEERQLFAGGRLARRFFESIKEDPMKLGIEGE